MLVRTRNTLVFALEKISDSFTTCKIRTDGGPATMIPKPLGGFQHPLWYLRPSISTVGEGVDKPGAEGQDETGAAASGRLAECVDGVC